MSVSVPQSKIKLNHHTSNQLPKHISPVMEVNTRQQVQGILDGKIVGHRICHIWYDQENQEKTVYFGKIEKVSVSGPQSKIKLNHHINHVSQCPTV
jgi:hypothetical protein